MLRKSKEFRHQLARTLGHVYYRGADVGEVLATAQRVEEGDREGWYQVWHELAERMRQLGHDSVGHSEGVSARDSYFRAAEAMRQAIFFLRDDLSDPRIESGSKSIQEWFLHAARLERWPIQPVQIPFERGYLPGYIGLASTEEPRPLIIAIGGYDGTAEELYFTGGLAALERGYHCLLFDGPGQGHALYQHELVMRPDWENVIAPVMDWAVQQEEIDPGQIALVGHSLGGYMAPRAASEERRLTAVVADPGQYSLIQAASRALPGNLWDRFCGSDDHAFNREAQRMMQSHPDFRFTIKSRMAAHGKATPYEWLDHLTEFTNEGRIEKITCPTLICSAEGEHLNPGQAEQLFNELQCEKEMILFTKEEGAGDHCEAMAQSLFCTRMFNWLDQYLQIRA